MVRCTVTQQSGISRWGSNCTLYNLVHCTILYIVQSLIPVRVTASNSNEEIKSFNAQKDETSRTQSDLTLDTVSTSPVCSEAGIISWAACHVTASSSIIHCFVLLRLDSFCLNAVLMQPILGLRVIQIKATLDFVGEKVKL